jgi:LmbE family N-acetylglucosaminyl deacetylase
MKKRVLVIVAHPDDETIWMGGTLLDNKDKWETTLISLCRKDDADRAPKFKKVCKHFNTECHISDLDDEKMNNIDSTEVISRVKKFIQNKEFDYIFTHGENGEYGHKRHVDVHKAVIKMVNKEELKAKKVFFFSYASRGEFAYPKKGSDKLIYLNDVTLKEKKQLIQYFYGYPKGGFEEVCCRNIEAFNIKK